MMEATIENYMVLETILGGVIILLLLRADWQRSKIIKELAKANERIIINQSVEPQATSTTIPLVESIPKDVQRISNANFDKGAATDKQFLRKEKKK